VVVGRHINDVCRCLPCQERQQWHADTKAFPPKRNSIPQAKGGETNEEEEKEEEEEENY
jgi:hypothetical protein